MANHLFFYIGLSLLMMHEMDAIRCKEWQIFPLVSLLNDRMGYIVFMLAHIPLFVWIFMQLSNPENEAFIKGFDYFFIIHLGLHLLFLLHPKNEFKDWISWGIIVGAAVCGGVDLVM